MELHIERSEGGKRMVKLHLDKNCFLETLFNIGLCYYLLFSIQLLYWEGMKN